MSSPVYLNPVEPLSFNHNSSSFFNGDNGTTTSGHCSGFLKKRSQAANYNTITKPVNHQILKPLLAPKAANLVKRFINLNYDVNSSNEESSEDLPNQLALKNMYTILVHSLKENLVGDVLGASDEGGVGMAFFSGNKQANIECFNTGEVLASIFSREYQTEVLDVDLKDLKPTFDRFREFL